LEDGIKFIFTFVDNVAHNLCCQISQSHEPAHVLMRLYPIDKSLFVYEAKEGRHVRMFII